MIFNKKCYHFFVLLMQSKYFLALTKHTKSISYFMYSFFLDFTRKDWYDILKGSVLIKQVRSKLKYKSWNSSKSSYLWKIQRKSPDPRPIYETSQYIFFNKCMPNYLSLSMPIMQKPFNNYSFQFLVVKLC